jgi:hypothetical protein
MDLAVLGNIKVILEKSDAKNQKLSIIDKYLGIHQSAKK